MPRSKILYTPARAEVQFSSNLQVPYGGMSPWSTFYWKFEILFPFCNECELLLVPVVVFGLQTLRNIYCLRAFRSAEQIKSDQLTRKKNATKNMLPGRARLAYSAGQRKRRNHCTQRIFVMLWKNCLPPLRCVTVKNIRELTNSHICQHISSIQMNLCNFMLLLVCFAHCVSKQAKLTHRAEKPCELPSQQLFPEGHRFCTIAFKQLS